jgi:hypothetical protein
MVGFVKLALYLWLYTSVVIDFGVLVASRLYLCSK